MTTQPQTENWSGRALAALRILEQEMGIRVKHSVEKVIRDGPRLTIDLSKIQMVPIPAGTWIVRWSGPNFSLRFVGCTDIMLFASKADAEDLIQIEMVRGLVDQAEFFEFVSDEWYLRAAKATHNDPQTWLTRFAEPHLYLPFPTTCRDDKADLLRSMMAFAALRS